MLLRRLERDRVVWQAQEEWLSTFLELPNGIPSHDTFNRFFAALNPQALQPCFLNWIQEIARITGGA